MPTLTAIRLYTQPRFSQEPSLKETLVIDFRYNNSAAGSEPGSEVGLFDEDLWSEMINRIQTSTSATTTSLEILGDDPLPLKLQEALLSVEGLTSIETIAVETGFCEDLDLSFLPSSNPWPIKTLQIGSACSGDIPPHVLQKIKSLRLDYCCGLNFRTAPPTESAELERLEIIENDALGMFTQAFDSSCITRTLTYLKLEYTNGCDFSDHDDFWERLKQVSSLRTLAMKIFEKEDTDLRLACQKIFPRSVPSGLVAFSFIGSPWVSQDLSVWEDCIKDVNGWLPNLERFGCEFSLVAESSSAKATRKAQLANLAILEEAEERTKKLKSCLLAARPNVRLELEE
ncbi:hypothetical protein DL96DRAFT_1607615 [Flagelloscypha sp. PMI_526]|nr:hypothetical protein DL96DRAFT_1607615 [Flagelloscypha sp. PMI_526]